MRVFITGHKGQLGRALLTRLPGATGADLPEVDITTPEAIDAAIAAARPEVIIHCAAMTDVDSAARDPALAYRVNGLGTQNVALAAARAGAALAYVSTNEVFDGAKRAPYFEFDAGNPINPYGQSKLAGEWFTTHLTSQFYLIRTAWLSAPGGRNFAHRIQQLADERGQLSVVVTLASLYPASTILLARFVLHERLTLLQHVGIGIGDDHLRAFLRQQVCDSLTDTVCAGAHIGKLALQLIVHESPFSSSRLLISGWRGTRRQS